METSTWLYGCECLTDRSRCAPYHTADLYSRKCVSASGENPSRLTCIQVFSLTCIPRTDRVTVWKMQKRTKKFPSCPLSRLLSCMIYEMGGGTWLSCVCTRGQMRLLYVLARLRLYLSAPRSHLFSCWSCLSNVTHTEAPKENALENRSFSLLYCGAASNQTAWRQHYISTSNISISPWACKQLL